MSKHTAGKWSNIGTFVYALNENGTNVFSALVQDAYTSEEELKAIARLMSAAPCLLEALEAVCKVLDGLNIVSENSHLRRREVLLLARAAIAKATGGE